MADQLSDEIVLSLLEDRIFKLNDSDVFNLARRIKEPQLTNVINGFEDQSFGLYQSEEESITKVGIFYIHSDKYDGLNGLFVDFEISEKFRDRFVFFFSQVLIREYPHLELIDTFNTFQGMTRLHLENHDYFTFNPLTLPNQYKDSIMLSNSRGVVPIVSLNKVQYYQSLFGYSPYNYDTSYTGNYIYIMLNDRNNLFKIGRSIRPYQREKTLAGQEPEIEIIALWKAPVATEKVLHKLVAKHHTRGEWFNLSTEELKKINEAMAEY